MIKAIARYLRAFGYLITGRIDAARKELSTNPYVVKATYDNVIEEKTKRISHYKDAVGGLVAQEEKKLARVKQLTEDVNRLEQLKEGAAAKARSLVKRLQGQGLTEEQVKANDEYRQCLAAFNDFSSTVEEKTRHIEELEADVRQIAASIGNHKIQLQELVREIDKLKEEASSAVADMITSREEEELADMITGISRDTSAKELQDLRDLRHQVKAKARISRELAGTDTKRQEAEFMDYARKSAANTEFEQLIGLAGASDDRERGEAQGAEPRLPE